MALITRQDVEKELLITDPSGDEGLLEAATAAVLSLLDELTGRTWAEGERTEYYDAEDYCDQISLNNRPVNQTATFEVYDDPDWEWAAGDLVSASDYRVDYEAGIVYHGSYFYGGKQSIKVAYTAGYTDENFPDAWKKILVRQAAVLFKQAKTGTQGLQSITIPAGGGGASIERHVDGLMPDFLMLVERESR